jgi:hypothetical protein
MITVPSQTTPTHPEAPSISAADPATASASPPTVPLAIAFPKSPRRAPRKATAPKPVARAASPSKAGTKAAAKKAPTPATPSSAPEKARKQEPRPSSHGIAKKHSSAAAEKSAAISKKAHKPKEKLVRDSFTMPQDDYALIARLKDRALMFKRPAKKSELLRAGLHALQALSAPALREALDSLTPLKAGRPKRGAL